MIENPNCKIENRMSTKLVKSTLVGLYLNLIFVIGAWIFLFWGLANDNYIIWILILFSLAVTGIINIVLTAKNIINSYLYYKNRDYNDLRRYMKILKFGTIPYLIVNFVFNLLIFLLFFAASRGLIVFSPIPMFFLIPISLTYLTVLFTSCYGIGLIIYLWKDTSMLRMPIIHVLMQVCFILDVVDTIILLMKYNIKEDVTK